MTGRLTLKLEKLSELQYIPRNMPTVFALLCFVVVIHWLIFPYPPGLLRWHCGNLTIAPVPAKQPWWIWINTSCEIIMNDYITTTKQSTTKPCAYLLGYTVSGLLHTFRQRKRASRSQLESLAGKFCGASHVVPWGRTHLRSIYVSISSLKSPTLVVWPGGIIGSTMGKIGDIFGPQPLLLMYLPMPVPMVAEDYAAVTRFMRTGPMTFHV